MPIYEYACSKCRRVFSFFSRTLTPSGLPTCPKCGNERMEKVMSRFAMPKGVREPLAQSENEDGMPKLSASDEAKMEGAMSEIEKDLDYMDENNPKHLAHLMNKMKDAMPAGVIPKEFDQAIKRLEKGEDIEKVEEEMGPMFGMDEDDSSGYGGGMGGYSHDSGLYDF